MTDPSIPAPPRPSRRRLIQLLSLVLILGGVISGGYFLWLEWTTPTVPEVDLTHVEPLAAEGIAKARELVVKNPRRAEAWGEFAMTLHAHDFFLHAQACYGHAERFDPTNPVWPYLRADCWKAEGDARIAIEHLRRAALLSSTEPTPSIRLAELLMETGQVEESATTFQDVLRTYPSNPRAHLGLARIALSRGNGRASLSHINNCLAVTGDIPPALLLLAETYQDLGEPEMAADANRRASMSKQGQTWLDEYMLLVGARRQGIVGASQRAIAHYNAGRHEEAIQELAALLAKQPNSPKVLAGLGRMYVVCKQPANGLPHLRKAIELDPELLDAHFYLASGLMELQQHTEAVAEFRAVVARKPDYPDASHRLGQCLYLLRDRASAVEALLDAVRYAPNNVRAQKNLAIVLFELQRYDEAVTHFELAATLSPDDREIPRMLTRAKAARAKK